MLTSWRIGSAGSSAVPMSLIYLFPRRSLDCALGNSKVAKLTRFEDALGRCWGRQLP